METILPEISLNSETGQRLKQAIKTQLRRYLGKEYKDDSLAEYIVIMLGHKTDEQQVNSNLSEFLVGNSSEMTQWLFKNVHSIVQTNNRTAASTPPSSTEPFKGRHRDGERGRVYPSSQGRSRDGRPRSRTPPPTYQQRHNQHRTRSRSPPRGRSRERKPHNDYYRSTRSRRDDQWRAREEGNGGRGYRQNDNRYNDQRWERTSWKHNNRGGKSNPNSRYQDDRRWEQHPRKAVGERSRAATHHQNQSVPGGSSWTDGMIVGAELYLSPSVVDALPLQQPWITQPLYSDNLELQQRQYMSPQKALASVIIGAHGVALSGGDGDTAPTTSGEADINNNNAEMLGDVLDPWTNVSNEEEAVEDGELSLGIFTIPGKSVLSAQQGREQLQQQRQQLRTLSVANELAAKMQKLEQELAELRCQNIQQTTIMQPAPMQFHSFPPTSIPFPAPLTVLVQGICHTATKKIVLAHFSVAGRITRFTFLRSPVPGQPSGLAYVEYSSAVEAYNALALSGSPLLQSVVQVWPKESPQAKAAVAALNNSQGGAMPMMLPMAPQPHGGVKPQRSFKYVAGMKGDEIGEVKVQQRSFKYVRPESTAGGEQIPGQ